MDPLLPHQKLDSYLADILEGIYSRENNKEYILHPDGRKINISWASSGQQETLPLVLLLRELVNTTFQNRIPHYSGWNGLG